MADGIDGPRTAPAAGGAARQLVVLCHGLGADGDDLIDLARPGRTAVPDAAFAAPRCARSCTIPASAGSGGAWPTARRR